MTHMVDIELIEKQKRYEIHCVDEGVKRFRLNDLGGKLREDGTRTRKGLAERTATCILYSDILPGMIQRITELRNEAVLYVNEPPRGGRFAWGMIPLAILTPEQTAVITLRGILADEYSDKALAKKLTSAELKIGSMMFTQLEFEDWKCAEQQRAKDEEDYQSRYKKLIHFLKGQPVTAKNWGRFMSKFQQTRTKKDRNHMIQLGARLVQVAIEEGKGWFEVGMIFERGNGCKVIKFTDEALAALKDQQEHAELQKPMLRPMLCPPRPWVRTELQRTQPYCVPLSTV